MHINLNQEDYSKNVFTHTHTQKYPNIGVSYIQDISVKSIIALSVSTLTTQQNFVKLSQTYGAWNTIKKQKTKHLPTALNNLHSLTILEQDSTNFRQKGPIQTLVTNEDCLAPASTCSYQNETLTENTQRNLCKIKSTTLQIECMARKSHALDIPST